MSTRRSFLSMCTAAAAATVALVGGISFGSVKQVVRQRTRITLSQWNGTAEYIYPAPHALRCTTKTRNEMVRFVRTVRDSVWAPTKRQRATVATQDIYLRAYNELETRHIYRSDNDCWYIDVYEPFLVEVAPLLVPGLESAGFELCDDCNDRIMRKLTRRTKTAVVGLTGPTGPVGLVGEVGPVGPVYKTRTREVIRTKR